MKQLYLHCGGVEATYEEIKAIKTPKPMGPRHHPIDHTLLIDTTKQALEDIDCAISSESYGISNEGSEMFGLFHIEHDNPNGTYDQVVGLRDSHSQLFGAGLCAGAGVFVCDNLAFSAEIKVSRKHTRYIERDLKELLAHAASQLADKWLNQQIRYDAYFDKTLTNEEAHDIIIRAAIDHKALPNAQIQHVVNEWREPEHDVFQERTAWSLFNAFTSVAKRAPTQLLDRTITLHNVFDTVCRDEIKQQQLAYSEDNTDTDDVPF